jgi:hypothetical protein
VHNRNLGLFQNLRMGRLIQTDVCESEGRILDDDVFVVAVVIQQVDDGVDGDRLALGEKVRRSREVSDGVDAVLDQHVVVLINQQRYHVSDDLETQKRMTEVRIPADVREKPARLVVHLFLLCLLEDLAKHLQHLQIVQMIMSPNIF